MRYLLLIHVDEAARQRRTEAEWSEFLDSCFRLTADLQRRGLMKGGEALQPTALSKTVRVRDGKTLVTDGPYAETKEQLGGFYLIECESTDAAQSIAAEIGALHRDPPASIEVRPASVLDMAGVQGENAESIEPVSKSPHAARRICE